MADTPTIEENHLNIENFEITQDLEYADLYVLGKLWVDLLKIGLLGPKWRIIPVVEAAYEAPPPTKPLPMKYKDLPLYQSPHFEYKEYLENQHKSEACKVRLIHNFLLPKVKYYRETVQRNLTDVCAQMRTVRADMIKSINNNKDDFKKYMRDPNNLVLRQVVLGMAGLTGYYLGSGTPNIPKKIFFTSCGLLAAGALCFPKETDETFREIAFNVGKCIVTFYNTFCGKEYRMKEKKPCEELTRKNA